MEDKKEIIKIILKTKELTSDQKTEIIIKMIEGNYIYQYPIYPYIVPDYKFKDPNFDPNFDHNEFIIECGSFS